jgi:hypothetical protein
MGSPATRTWSTDFLLREGLSREEIGKWIKNKSIPRQRTLFQVVTGTFSCGQQLQKKHRCRRTAPCILCQRAHGERGSSWKGELPKETIGHIQSAGCPGQKGSGHRGTQCKYTGATARRPCAWKADGHMRLLTIETESNLCTLWDQEECNQLCSKASRFDLLQPRVTVPPQPWRSSKTSTRSCSNQQQQHVQVPRFSPESPSRLTSL